MKITIAFGFALLLSIILGCSGADKDTVTDKGGVYAEAGTGVSGQPATQQPAQTDPESSGGSDLAASQPYAGTASATQNINGAPFLTASEESPGQRTAAGQPGQSRLTSRADGTMMSPSDQPAAGIGPGLTVESTPNPSRATSAAGTAKPNKP